MGHCAKSEDFKYIEECFKYIMSGEDVDEHTSRIERALGRIFPGQEFNVAICENVTNKFFGVCVFPTIEAINNINGYIFKDKDCEADIVKCWQRSKNWYVEIDNNILWGLNAKFNPAEITALMLYQLGSTIYSNVVPVTINRIFRYKFAEMDYEMKALITNSNKIRSLMSLATLEACTTKNFRFIDCNVEHCVVSSMMCSLGYCEEFNNFIGKLMNLYGNTYINRTQDEFEKDINIVVNWAIDNIRRLEFRTTALRDALKTEMINNDSVVVKNAVQAIYNSFFGGVLDNYRVLLSEQYMDTPRDVVAEMEAVGFLLKEYRRIVAESATMPFDKNGKLKKVSQLDIDVLAVDIDRIETHDDKVYLLDRLYDMLQIVEAGLEYIESGDKTKVTQSKQTLTEMRTQLISMRSQILSTRIIEKEYGVFIKYPKGYEH